MQADKTEIPESLSDLKLSSDLDSVSISSLARKGTSVLQQILATAEGVTVEIQGQGAMVTVSRRQYDEMVAVIQKMQLDVTDDGFRNTLCDRFDELITNINQPGAAESTRGALFADPAELNQTYQPGETETVR